MITEDAEQVADENATRFVVFFEGFTIVIGEISFHSSEVPCSPS